MVGQESFLFATARKEDAVSLVRVFLDATALDKSISLMYAKEEIWAILLEIIEKAIESEYFMFGVAKDRKTGDIVSWTSIAIIPKKDAGIPADAYYDWSVVASQKWLAMRRPRENLTDERNRLRQRLIHILGDRSLIGQENFLQRPRMVIKTLVTECGYQRRGIGFWLLGKVVVFACIQNWPMWAQVPSQHRKIFEQHGFHQVGSVDLALQHFVPKSRSFIFDRFGIGRMREFYPEQSWKQMIWTVPATKDTLDEEELKDETEAKVAIGECVDESTPILSSPPPDQGAIRIARSLGLRKRIFDWIDDVLKSG